MIGYDRSGECSMNFLSAVPLDRVYLISSAIGCCCCYNRERVWPYFKIRLLQCIVLKKKKKKETKEILERAESRRKKSYEESKKMEPMLWELISIYAHRVHLVNIRRPSRRKFMSSAFKPISRPVLDKQPDDRSGGISAPP